MKESPLISVIVPVYNTEKYLVQCIRSILNQDHNNLEIICVNDGSSDNSLQILMELSRQDRRLKVLSQANAGVSAARNTGLDAATGDYVTFVDSDDELEPDMYTVLTRLMTQYHADIAHCGYKKIHMDGSAKDICGTGMLLVQNAEEATQNLIEGKCFAGSICNKLYRRSFLAAVRLNTSLKINEDILFNAQLFQKAKTIVFLDVPKYHYFERENSSCFRTQSLRKYSDSAAAFEEILQMHRNTSLEPVAAKRFRYCLIALYRAYLYDNIKENQSIFDQLHQQICDVSALCPEGSFRDTMNYTFMRTFPRCYKWIYYLYDHIRKPNWDL